MIFLSHQQLKDHLHTLEELRDQVVKSDIHQFDSRVEEIEQQLHQALLSYGILVSTSAVAGRNECGGRQHVMSVDEESSLVDDGKCISSPPPLSLSLSPL